MRAAHASPYLAWQRVLLLSGPLLILLSLPTLLSSCDNADRFISVPLEPNYVIVDTSPAWSPDGTTIAYYRFFPSSAGPPGIYVIQSDGTNNRLLLESSVWTRDLRFSPDSTRLSLTLSFEIYIVDHQTRTLRQLTNSRGNAQSGDWSPDSRFLVYTGPYRPPWATG